VSVRPLAAECAERLVQQFFPVGDIHHPGIADEFGHPGYEQSLAHAGRRDDELAPYAAVVSVADRPKGVLLVREQRKPLGPSRRQKGHRIRWRRWHRWQNLR
jgi:hypothetical protein